MANWMNIAGKRFVFNRGRWKESGNVGSQSAKKGDFVFKGKGGVGQAYAKHGREIAELNNEIEKQLGK